ncbi:MAG TPA: phage major capsid protein [Arthrobacter sp.]
MAVTLAEAAPLIPDNLQRGVVETFVQASPVLDRLPIKGIGGNAYSYNTEGTLPGIAFRGVNEAYTESTGTFNQRTETLAIMGGDADVDKFIVATGSELNDQKALQTAAKVKAASYKFQETFINGDVSVDPKAFDGLKKRLTGNQVIDAATNGLGPVTAGNDFFDALDALIAAVPGLDANNGALYANSKIIAKIKSSGRRLGGVDMVREDITGKRVVQYNGIALLDIGQTAAGADIIAQNETQGTAAGTASSIYAVKFGGDETDQAVTGLASNGLLYPAAYDLGELQTKPAYRVRIDWYCGLAVFGGRAAARLRGVLNS